MLAALLLGDRRDIDPETYEAFRKTGLAHIISLSGMNLRCPHRRDLVVLQARRAPQADPRGCLYRRHGGLSARRAADGADPPGHGHGLGLLPGDPLRRVQRSIPCLWPPSSCC